MSVFLDISGALDTRLDNLVGKPPIAWENKGYEPVKGTLYARPSILPGETVQASLGDTGQDMTVGVYQVDIFAKAGKGKNEAVVMADLIANWFKRGTVLTYNSRKVRIRNVSRKAGINNAGGWFQIPIEIAFISYTEARV